MVRVSWCVFSAATYFSTLVTVHASEIPETTLEKVTAETDLIAHVRPTSISQFTAHGAPCGLKVVADVEEVLKGTPVRNVTFFTGFGAHFLVGAETVVFLVDFDATPLRDLYEEATFNFAGGRQSHARACSNRAPRHLVHLELPYTSARRDPTAGWTDYPTGDDVARLRWINENLMLEIPNYVAVGSIEGIRKVSVSVVRINGEITNIENRNAAGLVSNLVPAEFILAPAAEVKRNVRDAVSAN